MWILMVVTWHGRIVAPYCICFFAFTKFCYYANDLALAGCDVHRSDGAPSPPSRKIHWLSTRQNRIVFSATP